MRRSLIKTLVFSGILLVLIFVCNAFLDAQMKKLNYEDASVWNEIAKGGIDAEVVISGSSRAATHIDPSLISKETGKSCYNLGMMGHNFFIEDARYAFYLEHNKPPKTIILSLDYESLQRRPDLFNPTQFLAYLDDSIIAYATKQYDGFSKYDYQLPLLKYVGEQTLIFSLVRNWLEPSSNKSDRLKGFFARDFRWNAEVDKILDTLKPYMVKPDSISLSAFECFLNECKSQQIQVIFVHTPVHPLGQQKVINRQQIMALYHDYAARFQIPFFDYATDSMCRNKSYFMNSTHLNQYGAAFFTRKLIADLRKDKWL